MKYVEFLRARIAEDKAFAAAAKGRTWTFSTHTDLARIVFIDEKLELGRRVKHAVRALTPSRQPQWERELMAGTNRWRNAWTSLTHRSRHLPDGAVAGKIITFWMEDGEHIERWDPDRVLRECDVKLGVVEVLGSMLDPDAEVGDWSEKGMAATAASDFASWTLRTMTRVWADHPDFDPAWAQ